MFANGRLGIFCACVRRRFWKHEEPLPKNRTSPRIAFGDNAYLEQRAAGKASNACLWDATSRRMLKFRSAVAGNGSFLADAVLENGLWRRA